MTANPSNAENETHGTVLTEEVDGGGAMLAMGATVDRCHVCSAELAPDQRYCVECGARRGKPRFALAASGPQKPAPAATSAAPNLWTRATVLLGTLVVLVAIGVGVLIGNAGKTSPVKQPIRVVLSGQGVAALSGGAGATATGGATTTPSGGKSTKTPPASTTTTSSGGNFFSGS